MAIDNTDDVIDSRYVISEIEELEAQLDEEREAALAEGTDFIFSKQEQLDSLRKLAEQCETMGDWEDGCALIRESYFQEYAEQLADDLGLLQKGARWPYRCIDWDQAARELKQDYTAIDFDGVTYYVR